MSATKHSLTLPRLIGHRGARALAPENTLDSFAIAVHAGVKWIECDAKISSDSVPILMHDDTLDRTTNGSGKVADMTYDDLMALEAGSWFSDSFAGIGIPSLEEALDWCTDHHVGLNIEIKPCPGRDVETAEAVLDLVTRSIDDTSRVLISSFSLGALSTALDYAPELPRALLLEADYPTNWEEIADYLQVEGLHINGAKASEFEAARFVKHGLPVRAYTINDAARARQLFNWGVASVFSDIPDLLDDED